MSDFISLQPQLQIKKPWREQLYSDMIFPLVAATDGERARLLPQVCSSWRQCFAQAKVNWETFAMTQPVKDLSKLYNVLSGAYRLNSLKLVCEEGAAVEAPHCMRMLLQQLTQLAKLSLIAPGPALSSTNMQLVATCVTDLRIEAAPEVDIGVAQVRARGRKRGRPVGRM